MYFSSLSLSIVACLSRERERGIAPATISLWRLAFFVRASALRPMLRAHMAPTAVCACVCSSFAQWRLWVNNFPPFFLLRKRSLVRGSIFPLLCTFLRWQCTDGRIVHTPVADHAARNVRVCGGWMPCSGPTQLMPRNCS